MIVTALGWRLKYLNTMTVMITIYEITIYNDSTHQ